MAITVEIENSSHVKSSNGNHDKANDGNGDLQSADHFMSEIAKRSGEDGSEWGWLDLL